MGKGVPVAIGIDEAGRGPVVGDMVIGMAVIPIASLEHLRGIGVQDSKKLQPATRRRLYAEILSRSIYIATAYVPPPVIDSGNLNDVTVRYLDALVATVPRSLSVKRVAVDMVGGRTSRIREAIRGRLGGVEVFVEEGADVRFVEVAAASIVAKVERDTLIRFLGKAYGLLGSGYPSDPRTRRWLTTYTGEAYIVRRTWRTLRSLNPGLYKPKHRGPQRTLLDYLG